MKLFFSRHWKTLLVFFCLFTLFFLNAFHEKYPDEFDSIVGGRYITEGKLPYRDWFQHHQPGAYVMAAAILPFSGRSFVHFRVGWESVLFVLLVTSYVLLLLRMPKRNMSFYVCLLYVIALSGTYYWGHMLLADTLAGYFMLPAFALLFLKDFYREPFAAEDLAIVGWFAFLSWFTSMTFIYIVMILSLYGLYLYIRTRKGKGFLRRAFAGIGILAIPYVLFGLYLAFTGSIPDYYWANVVYNTNYYIYNYPHAPGSPINPIRYAAVIADRFINNFLPAVWGVTGFPIGDPMQVTLAFSSAAAIGLVIAEGHFLFLIPLVSTLIFANARSNPQAIKETDYQAFMYIIISYFNGLFVLSAVRELLNGGQLRAAKRLGYSILYAALLLYWVAMTAYFGMKMEQKYFAKYMGRAPLIYDRPQIAQYVNAIVSPDDYVYIGPFEFEELFYLNTKNQPSKYHWFLDHAKESKIKDELIADLKKHRPKVIVFQRDFAPWGGNPRGYNWWMQEFLDTEYFRIFTLNGSLKDKRYEWTIGKTQNFDPDAAFNFDKRYQKEILEKLLSLGYIKAVAK